jgi:O-antigen/teichoic acid export membrane protein
MAAAIMARVGLLILAVVLARRFGPQGYGTFTFATGTALLVAQFSVLGWPMLMNRLIPTMLRERDWGALKGLRDAGDAIVLTSGVTAAIILAGVSWLVPHLRLGLLLAALLVLPFSFGILRRQQLAAVRRPALGLLFAQGFGAILTVMILLVMSGGVIEDAVVMFAAAIGLGILITTMIFRRQLPTELAAAERETEIRRWMSIALPMLVGLSSKLIMNKTDIVMLAPLSNLHEAGLYGAAFRLTYLLTFPQVVMMSVMLPLFSEAFADGRRQQVKRLLRTALLFATATAVPTSLLLVLYPKPIMTGLFGGEFGDAASSLVLLTIGQLATSLSIPFQAILTMSGRERVYGGVNLFALGLHVALNLLLVPLYGATGAAGSTAAIAIMLLLAQIALYRASTLRENRDASRD